MTTEQQELSKLIAARNLLSKLYREEGPGARQDAIGDQIDTLDKQINKQQTAKPKQGWLFKVEAYDPFSDVPIVVYVYVKRTWLIPNIPTGGTVAKEWITELCWKVTRVTKVSHVPLDHNQPTHLIL